MDTKHVFDICFYSFDWRLPGPEDWRDAWILNYSCFSLTFRGRKRACMLFGFFQALGCFAKQYPEFRILCFAHVSLGIATSLLYSSFESWMVVEHEKVRLSSSTLVPGHSLIFCICLRKWLSVCWAWHILFMNLIHGSDLELRNLGFMTTNIYGLYDAHRRWRNSVDFRACADGLQTRMAEWNFLVNGI